MTINEFNTEFDILYNNITSGAAPGINKYEKSVFLTNAQNDIVLDYYSGNIKKLIPAFEQNERKRRELGELVRTHVSYYSAILNSNLEDRKIDYNSVFFELPSDVFFILYESGITYNDPCTGKGRKIKIIPSRHDYWANQEGSPFRGPDEKHSLRLDLEDYNNKKIVELIHRTLPLKSYYIRYIHTLSPIILVNFEDDPELSGQGLTIGGKNTITNTELEHLDLDILTLAVNKAILRYRENALQSIKNF